MKVKHRLWAAIGAVCLPSLAVAADDWQAISMVSNTLGVNTNRVCLGAPSTARESDMGCPADAPLWQNGGLAITGGVSATNVSVTANLTAAGATITNIGAGAIAANSLSSTLVSASNISATYVDATRNGTVSATYGYFGNIYGDGSGLTGVTAGSADWYDLTGIPTQVQAVSNSGAITLSGVSATNVSVTTNLTAAGATISSIGANAIAANSLSSTLVSASNISATYVDATRGGTVSATYGYFSQLSGTLPASMISGPITASSVAWGAITGTPATITSLTTTNLTTTSGIEAKDIIYFDGTNYDNASATTLLGLGTMAYQNANSVAITGGTASLAGVSATNVSVTTNLTAAGATITNIGAGAIAANSLSSTLVSASNISATYVDATRDGTVSATYGYFSQISGSGAGLYGIPAAAVTGLVAELDDLSDAAKDTTGNNMFIGHEGGSFGAQNQYNTGIGLGALDALDGTGGGVQGRYNTAVGYNVLTSNTTGNFNTAIGADAMYANISGYYNTAIGHSSLTSNTSGGYNTSSGVEALKNNTSGSNNTASGWSSLYSNTTGMFNSAYGVESLRNNTDGEGNTAVGNASLRGNTTGNNNTANGSSSLYYNTTGSQNVAVGRSAGLGVNGSSIVSNSVIVGYRSGYAVTTAEGNVMVGMEAGDEVTSGDNNTLLGTQAGDNITTGSSNIIIGSGVDAGSATGDSQLNIGNTVYGDLSTDKVGVGNASPLANLDVTGSISASDAVQVGASSLSCGSGIAGAIRYNGGSLELCNGSSWTALAAGGSTAWGSLTGVPTTVTSLTTTNLTTTSGIAANEIIYFNGTEYDNASATTLLGLGTMAYQNANSVAITGGTASLAGVSATNVSVTANLTAAGATISNIGANAIAANSLSSTLVSASNISATYVDATRGGTVSATYGYFSQISGSGAGLYGIPAAAVTGLSADRITSDTTSIVANDVMDSISFTTAGSERMVVTSAGNVGIGTSAPLYRLHVNGGATVISDSLFSLAISTTGSAANNGMTIAQYGSGDANLSFLLPTARRWNLGVDNSDSDKFKILADNSNDYSGAGLTITTNGKLGVSNTSPLANLDVTGSISASDAVQVGASSLSCGSGIAGAIRYNSTSNTLQICNSVGWVSLNSNTAAGVSAINDLSDAAKETTGYNMFIGHEGGSFGAQNQYNTGIGLGALDALDGTGSSNEGRFNTAAGYNALTNNVLGYYNTAVGYSALSANTSGTHNSGFGMYALMYNTWGQSNVAVGVNAGLGVNGATVTSRSVYVGARSGAAITTAENNVMVGFEAGDVVTSGDNNTLLGTQAGDNITTGSSNIIIGSGVDAGSATGDSQLNIGNTIYGNLSTDTVGIGITTPATTLDVSGSGTFRNSSDSIVIGLGSIELLRTSVPTNVNGFLDFKDSAAEDYDMRFWYAGVNNEFVVSTAGTDGFSTKNLFTIERAGNIGIGTVTPGATLDVTGSISASDAVQVGSSSLSCGSGIAGAIKYSSGNLQYCNGSSWTTLAAASGSGYADRIVSDTTSIVANDGMDSISFTTAGSERMVVTSAGNVGIGTSVPRATLDVGSGNLSVRGRAGNDIVTTVLGAQGAYIGWNEAGGGGRTHFMNHPGTGVGGWQFDVYSNAGAYERTPFYIAGTTGAYANNVGVGTSAPSANVHVYENNTSEVATELVRLDNPSLNGTNNGTSLGFYQSSTQYGRIRNYYTAANGWTLNLGAGAADHMTLKTNGNVGIGTNAPASTLHVEGTLTVSNSSLSALRVDSSRRVGFGVDSPISTLDIYVSNTVNRSHIGYGATFDNYFSTGAAGSQIFRRYNNQTDLIINGSGLVGIGTDNPTERLTVSATANADLTALVHNVNTGASANAGIQLTTDGGSGYLYRTSQAYSGASGTITNTLVIQNAASTPIAFFQGGTERMRIHAVGNVGIGTATPGAKLDVSGSIVSRAYNAGSGTSIDFSQGNVAYTSAACGAFTLSNMADGGAYTLVVTGSGTGPATFSHSGLTAKTTATLTCTTAKHTVFSFLRAGSNFYVSMVTGY